MLRIIFLLSLVLCLDLQGQTCLHDYSFNRQGQIDSFSILYPGCTEIEGNLEMSGYNINNFNGLHQLRHIQGELYIFDTQAYNLSGLDSIASVGSLYVFLNYNLKNIDALHRIENLEKLTIKGNSVLTDYSGLSSLKVVNTIIFSQIPITDLTFLPSALSFKNIELDQLNKLQSLNGFPHGDSFIEGIENIVLTENPLLTDINALLGIKKLKSFALTRDDQLTSLAGLDSLEVINSVNLFLNDNLTNITALYHLKEIQELYIGVNPSLLNLQGLESITSINNIRIFSNITSLEGLNQLRVVKQNAEFAYCNFEDLTGLGLDTVYGNLSLDRNQQLINLNGLPSLKYVGGELSIYENPELITLSHLDSLNYINRLVIIGNVKLEDLDGFEDLHEIRGALRIAANTSLADISGISSIEKVGDQFLLIGTNLTNLEGLNKLDTVKGLFGVWNNPVLTDLSAIHQIDYVGEFKINSNASLQHLPLFENLLYIPGNIEFIGNPVLQSIFGLSSLRYLDGDIVIIDNPQLTSLNGLDSINHYFVENVRIFDNPNLSTCESTFMCRYLNNGRPRTIMNNAVGCNSVAEIEARCGTLANSELEEIEISIYPNPTSGSVYLTAEQIINNITLLDASGIPIYKMNNPNNEIDMSPFPAGIYFIQIQMDSGIVMKKVVKN